MSYHEMYEPNIALWCKPAVSDTFMHPQLHGNTMYKVNH